MLSKNEVFCLALRSSDCYRCSDRRDHQQEGELQSGCRTADHFSRKCPRNGNFAATATTTVPVTAALSVVCFAAISIRIIIKPAPHLRPRGNYFSTLSKTRQHCTDPPVWTAPIVRSFCCKARHSLRVHFCLSSFQWAAIGTYGPTAILKADSLWDGHRRRWREPEVGPMKRSWLCPV